MKRVNMMLTVVVISLTIGSASFAQSANQAGHTAVMDSGHQTSDLTSLMNDMSGMMGKMAGMVDTSDPAKMKKLSGLVKELSKEMANMSQLLSRGAASDRELEKMHVRLMKMQRMLPEMGKK